MNRHIILSLALAGPLALASLAPTEARACGGTFCDSGPQSQPVDQTGEVIAFALDGDSVEAHIQIQYNPETEAMRFAWIIPVMGAPELEVGSYQFFLNLQNATVPGYGFQTIFESCGTGGGTCTGSSGGDPTGGTDQDTTGGPELVEQGSVGAFDYVVLQAQDANDLMQWLAANQYYQDPAAGPILQEYIDEGALFVALRLTQGAGLGEIHPIVIHYPGDEPCVPIRLTRIAAQADMEIRAFLLGDTRFAPTNYRHLEYNPVKLDWLQFADNYRDVVSMAVDEAGGHAFVTEFAGPADLVSTASLWSPEWDASVFAAADPVTVVDLLAAQGLFSCAGDMCTAFHPLVMGLLARYLPVPDNLEADAFYACLPCYQDQIDMNAWDGPGLAQDVQERIIDPGVHALDLLDLHPTLTRLYTTISPPEMTVDPTFHRNYDLPEVDRRMTIAQIDQTCSGERYFSGIGYPAFPIGFDWPDIAPEQMPWAERVEQIPPAGAPQVIVDNHEIIETLIEQWADGPLVPKTPRCDTDGDPSTSGSSSGGTDGTSGTGGTGGASDGGSDAGSGGATGGGPPSTDSEGEFVDNPTPSDGCGCRHEGPAPLAGLLALLAAGLLRRRRG